MALQLLTCFLFLLLVFFEFGLEQFSLRLFLLSVQLSAGVCLFFEHAFFIIIFPRVLIVFEDLGGALNTGLLANTAVALFALLVAHAVEAAESAQNAARASFAAVIATTGVHFHFLKSFLEFLHFSVQHAEVSISDVRCEPHDQQGL
jgi:hypothetical protein